MLYSDQLSSEMTTYTLTDGKRAEVGIVLDSPHLLVDESEQYIDGALRIRSADSLHLIATHGTKDEGTSLCLSTVIDGEVIEDMVRLHFQDRQKLELATYFRQVADLLEKSE